MKILARPRSGFYLHKEGDLEENRHFIEGKLVAHGQISIFYKMGAER